MTPELYFALGCIPGLIVGILLGGFAIAIIAGGTREDNIDF